MEQNVFSLCESYGCDSAVYDISTIDQPHFHGWGSPVRGGIVIWLARALRCFGPAELDSMSQLSGYSKYCQCYWMVPIGWISESLVRLGLSRLTASLLTALPTQLIHIHSQLTHSHSCMSMSWSALQPRRLLNPRCQSVCCWKWVTIRLCTLRPVANDLLNDALRLDNELSALAATCSLRSVSKVQINHLGLQNPL